MRSSCLKVSNLSPTPLRLRNDAGICPGARPRTAENELSRGPQGLVHDAEEPLGRRHANHNPAINEGCRRPGDAEGLPLAKVCLHARERSLRVNAGPERYAVNPDLLSVRQEQLPGVGSIDAVLTFENQ